MAPCWASAATQVYQRDLIYISSFAIHQAGRLTRMVGRAQAPTHGLTTSANRYGLSIHRSRITAPKFIHRAIHLHIPPRRYPESLWMMALQISAKLPPLAGRSQRQGARRATRSAIPNRAPARQIARRVGRSQQVHRRACIHCTFASLR